MTKQTGEPIKRAMPEALVGLVYDCVLRDDLLQTLLQRVAEHFGAVSAVLVYVDPVNAVATFSRAHGAMDDPEVQARYQRDFVAIDPAPAAFSSLKLGQAASSDIMFANSMDRSRPFIEGFLHPLGLGGVLAGIIANEGGKIGFFGLHRPRERAIFDESDIGAFEDVLRHVVKMIALRHVFYDMAAHRGTQTHALDQTAVGIMLFAANRQLIQANPASRAILARDDGLSINRLGMLIARDKDANETLETAFSHQGEDHAILVVPRREAALPYVLRISIDHAGLSRAHRAIHIWDPDRERGDASNLLSRAFGLTASSAKLVSALLTGETLDLYATRHGLSRSTAKFHLNAAFDATGTRRQSDLLRLAGTLVRDLGP